MREFLKGLDLDKETIDTIMAEHGKLITESKEKISELEDEVKSYKVKVEELESMSKENQKIQQELEQLKKTIQEKEEAEKKEAEEKRFNEEFDNIVGDKKFINDYTRQAIINEFKSALEDENNKDKEKIDIFNELTKDRMDLFINPNTVEIPATGDLDGETNKTEIPLIW